MFVEERCDRCGECLVRCPVLQMAREEAVVEVDNLLSGRNGSKVLSSCSTCLSCDAYCPSDAHPYHLILERWNEIYWKEGAPPVYRMVFPHLEPHLWSLIHPLLPEESRRAVEEWMTNRPSDTVLLVGSYNHVIPEVLVGSRLLEIEGAVAMDLPGHWECGAYLFQGGYLDVVKRVGEMVREDFQRWGVKRVIPLMDAVYIMLTRIQPREMGVEFSQEVVHFYSHLLERLERGELGEMRPLGLTVSIHDNCYAKADPDLFFATARRILELCGCRVVEMAHTRENSLCCGFGFGASRGSPRAVPFKIMHGVARKLGEAKETGAPIMVSYCGGCIWLLLAGNELLGRPVKVMHLLELVRLSLGEEVHFLREERGWDVLAAMTYQMARTFFSRPLFLEEVRAEMNPQSWRRPPRFLKVLRLLLSNRAGQALFRSGFSVLSRFYTREPL